MLAGAAGLALADASIVTLALPQLLAELHTTVVGVAAVIGVYTLVLTLGLLPAVALRRTLGSPALGAAALLVFAAASAGCASAHSLGVLLVFRGVQAIGGAGALIAAFDLIDAGSDPRGRRLWSAAAVVGFATGPALGGALTQAFDWRAIFIAQAPVAAFGLVGVVRAHARVEAEEGWRPSLNRTPPANACLGLLFGALVGALFLAVLLVISVWDYSPIAGAGIVSALPVAALAVRPLRLSRWTAVCGGSALLAAGLVGLALLPSASVPLAIWALALCGAGLGLAVPVLSDAALDRGAGLTRSGTLTVGARHVGLVLALALIAPLLASRVPAAGDRALLRGTAVLLDAPIGLDKKVPVALDLRKAFDRAQAGETPNLRQPFDRHGAAHDSTLAAVRDRLAGAIAATITRASRPAFFLCAGFAALALLIAVAFRRRVVP